MKFRINAVKTLSYTMVIEAENEHEADQFADDLTESLCAEQSGEPNEYFQVEVEVLND